MAIDMSSVACRKGSVFVSGIETEHGPRLLVSPLKFVIGYLRGQCTIKRRQRVCVFAAGLQHRIARSWCRGSRLYRRFDCSNPLVAHARFHLLHGAASEAHAAARRDHPAFPVPFGLPNKVSDVDLSENSTDFKVRHKREEQPSVGEIFCMSGLWD